MKLWWKQLRPYFMLLSLIGNLWLARQIYDRDHYANLYTWGNHVSRVWQHLSWAESDLSPGKDGRVRPGSDQGLILARAEIDGLRSFPHFSERVATDDLRTLEQFLQYVARSHALALEEQGESGTISAESVRRLDSARKGLYFVLTHNDDTNELKSSRNPWNHAKWRAVWADIARGLREMEFVPLPE